MLVWIVLYNSLCKLVEINTILEKLLKVLFNLKHLVGALLKIFGIYKVVFL